MNSNEALFKACKILDDNSINYWICNGTLLGIIREQRILPWDNDIDIAVWSHEVSKARIMKLFKESGFYANPLIGEMDCIDFEIDNIRIDISFYKVNNNVASVKWLLPAQGKINNIIYIFSYVLSSDGIPSYWKKYWPPEKLLRIIIASVVLVLRGLFPFSLRNTIASKGFNKIGYKGYSYPVSMLKSIKFNYNGNEIRVPAMFEQVLENTYGKDWRTPKKDFVWDKEAKNLINL